MTNEQREAILKVLDGLTALIAEGAINPGDHFDIVTLLDNALLDHIGYESSQA